jgi:hypothetical protein
MNIRQIVFVEEPKPKALRRLPVFSNDIISEVDTPTQSLTIHE